MYGRYWFPTYSYADEELVYDNGFVQHIRLRVKYSDFVKGHASVIIKDVEGDDKDAKPTPTPTPDKPQTAPLPVTEGQAPPTGVLNSRAIEMPQPVYPEEAKTKHITGTVKVEVTIDEQGNVIDAQAV